LDLVLPADPAKPNEKEEIITLKDDGEEVVDPPLHDDAKIEMKYSEWHYILVAGKEELTPPVVFNHNTDNWSFSKSIFGDPFRRDY
jgi:hypothetical protein